MATPRDPPLGVNWLGRQPGVFGSRAEGGTAVRPVAREGSKLRYSTDSTASGGRPRAALPSDKTIGRSMTIGFLTIAAIS
jgi:hypothetical protein